MIKLRNNNNYSIGLDIGTNSVGWCVIDDDSGELLSFKGRPTWGSRLFDEASTAEATRLKRGQRRRIQRRRLRVDLLQEFFAEEMEKVDPEFFVRMNASRLHADDKKIQGIDSKYPFFTNPGDEKKYYDRFPTIYHLRAYLTQSNEKADIRLIYLAFHNIVKVRGNFLQQENPNLRAANVTIKDAIERFIFAFNDYASVRGWDCSLDEELVENALNSEYDVSKKRSDIKDSIKKFLKTSNVINDKDAQKVFEFLCGATLGYKADFGKMFLCDQEYRFELKDDDKVSEFESACPDEAREIFEAVKEVYSAFVLLNILGEANGKTISFAKVLEYENYKQDLSDLKKLIKTYAPQEYDEFFRGPVYGGRHNDYTPQAKYYTKYNSYKTEYPLDAFHKDIKALFENVQFNEIVWENQQINGFQKNVFTNAEEAHKAYERMQARLDAGTFLKRQKTSDNGVIPYQLHLEEMELIIEKQGKFYPFLFENEEKIKSLVSFRRPYYVGPLMQPNSPKDACGNTRFAWAKKRAGMEGEPLRPWNWDKVVDYQQAAEDFITRMTGTCTYLQGEPVLPRASLTYQMFCVLNELNGAWYPKDEYHVRFTYSDREKLIEGLFKQTKSVTHKKVADFFRKEDPALHIEVHGTQDETKFVSQLSSWITFCEILKVDALEGKTFDMVEQIILWSTIFEDKKILKDRIRTAYGQENGGSLTENQIKMILNRQANFNGWGRLSEKLLIGLKVETHDGPKSIMDILIEGNPDSLADGRPSYETMIFQEILKDKTLGFDKEIELWNKENQKNLKLGVDELPGSPALKRGVNQTLRIVEEIVSIAKHAPNNIFIEVTREEDARNKGRTKKRYNKLKEGIANLKQSEPELFKALEELEGNLEKKKKDIDDRLYLYFSQGGKCMYSGQSLDIARLSEYQIDHILPQSYIKDDSLENKALVIPSENQRKADNLLLSNNVRHHMQNYWYALHEAKLIGDKKFNNLGRTAVKERQLEGFAARQLVETSQVIKFVGKLLEQDYSDTQVVPIKAGISSDIRERAHLVKCREANDFHHAHDAFLACQVGRFITTVHPKWLENPIAMTAAVKKMVQEQAEMLKKNFNRLPGSAGFIANSFLRTTKVNEDTGEYIWEGCHEIRKITKALNIPDCYISRMLSETSGAFWDETIYSPKNKKIKSKIPLKNDFDAEKYGAYTTEKYAYFFMYKTLKKGKQKINITGVPRALVSKIKSDNAALEVYAKRCAANSGEDFAGIIIPKILKWQTIVFDGVPYYITGKKEVRNAQQLAFKQDIVALISQTLDDDEGINKQLSENDHIALFMVLCNKYDRYAPKLANLFDLPAKTDSYLSININERKTVLRGLLNIANASTNKIDISALGGGKKVGCIKLTWNVEVKKAKEVYLVESSVTGMFESRYYLEV